MADLSQEIGRIPGGGKPFGDIYTTNTSATDDVSKAIMQHQYQMDLIGERQARLAQKALDAQGNKMGMLIRPGDQTPFTSLVGDWKNQSMDFNKNQNKYNLNDRVNAQQNVQGAYSKAATLASASAEDKKGEIATMQDIKMHPEKYVDNAGELLAKRMVTPLTGVNAIPTTDANGKQTTVDLTDLTPLQYKPSTDFSPVFKDATKQIQLQPQTDASGIDITTTKGIPTAPQIVSKISDFVKGNQKGTPAPKVAKDFLLNYGNIPDADYLAMQQQYNKVITNPDYLAAHNTTTDKLAENPTLTNTPLGKAAWYQAMKTVVENPNIDKTTNKKEVMDYQQEQRKEMADIRYARQWQYFKNKENWLSDQSAKSSKAVYDDQVKNGTPETVGVAGMNTPTGNIVLPVIQPIKNQLLKKDQPVMIDDGTGVLVPAKNSQGQPLKQDIPVDYVIKNGKDNNINVYYKDGSRQTMGENQWLGVITSSSPYNTKFKSQQVPNAKVTTTQTGGSSTKIVKIKGL